MKENKPNPSNQDKTRDPARRRTEVEGQNPKADDAPDHDVHHDENRKNPYEPEIEQGKKGSGKKS